MQGYQKTQNKFLLNDVDDVEELRMKIKKSIETKNNSFELSGKFIKEIPKEILSFEWLETLHIENTSMKYLSVLPSKIVNLIINVNLSHL